MAAGLIPRELLEFATDEELDTYVDFLEANLDDLGVDESEWTLQDRQQDAEDALADLDPTMSHELLYGGMAGGGKSDFMLWHLYNACLRYPGLSCLALRKTFPQLRRSLVRRALERFDRTKCRYQITETTWKFNNGSTLEFGYCETDTDVYNYDSAEYDIICWDELTQWPTSFAYLYLFSRLRTRASIRARGFVPHIIAATNPGRVGGAWVKARFVDVGPPDVRTVHALVDEEGNAIGVDDDGELLYGTRIFLPASLDQNRYISRVQYTAGLANLPEAQRDALLSGSWDAIEGQYFTEWDRTIHVVEPFAIPPWWTRVRAIDYGHAAPFCCLWLAFDGDATAWCYREAYERGLTPRQQAALILEMQQPGEKIAYTIIDPSTFSRTGVGVPTAQQYVDAGVPVRRGLNARIDGWARVRDFLRVAEVPPAREGDPETRTTGLRIFNTCTNLIRTLPMLVHDHTDPEDLDSDGEDHAADALRYALMSRPSRSRPPKKDPVTLEARMAQARKERAAERAGKRGVDHPLLGRI